MKQQNTILVCPLNWGLGHATRVIPIVRLLIKHQFKVILAAEGNAMALLRKEFPELEIITLLGYKVKFSAGKTQVLKMFLLFFKIIYHTLAEHLILKRLIKKHNIHIVISDNRFGLWNKNIYSIFITHQLQLYLPEWLKFAQNIYRYCINLVISKYNECWVPDFEGNNNLAGKLSHPERIPENVKYIGLLSRFSDEVTSENNTNTLDILFILSGPEPQRTFFEQIIYEQTKNRSERIVLVRGTEKRCNTKFDYQTFGLLSSIELLELLKQTKLVICRSGYSSVMDLVALKKRAVLVPTPGQTEQEYLADYLKTKNFFNSVHQESFTIDKVYDYSNYFYTETLKHSILENEIIRLSEIKLG